MISWNIIDSPDSLEKAVQLSADKDIVILKHSTTCSISHMAKMRLEDQWDFADNIIPFYLDLKAYRNVSDQITNQFSVHHESPQILLIRNGACIYDASHLDISVSELRETLAWHA